MPITTSMTTSFKTELLSAGHCFNATVNPTGTAASNSPTVTNIATAGIVVGMGVSGTGIAAGAVVATIDTATQISLSKNTTAAISGGGVTCSADVFKMALIKPAMAGTFGAGSTNYTNVGADEVTGTGYVAGGTALTNVSPTFGGTVAFVTFTSPSWSNATFSTAGCMIYNSSKRLDQTGNRACSVHDFGGSQQVSSGTFTVLMPTADSVNAIIRIS